MLSNANSPNGASLDFISCLQTIVMRFSDHVAIESLDAKISYRELFDASSKMASALVNAGVKKETRVGLYFSKSAEYITALLAVWMAGGAFIPLPKDQPRERIKEILKDCDLKFIASCENDISHLSESCTHISFQQAIESSHIKTIHYPQSEQLAYVIYTSGSSGKPKGVMINHAALVDVILFQIKTFKLKPHSRTLQYLKISFDASLSEIGTALLSGSTLVVADGASVQPGSILMDYIERNQITHLDFPPSLLHLLDSERSPACLESVIIGGEVPPLESVRRWAKKVHLTNVYGPTEATICTSTIVCDGKWDKAWIGKPLPHVLYQVVDDEDRPVTTGVGELLIGGKAISVGYFNNPELTAEKFFMKDGVRYYRTGDLVKKYSDDQYEFIGRRDRQIKINGQLVELQEVENKLNELEEVEQASVLSKKLILEGRDRNVLLAYVVLNPNFLAQPKSMILSELKKKLALKLSAWMIPTYFHFLDSLPRNSHEKIAYSELEAMAVNPADLQSEERLKTETENLVVQIWMRLLQVDHVSEQSDFFDLGGDSLLVLELVVAAQEIGLNLYPEMVYRNSCLSDLCHEIDRQNEFARNLDGSGHLQGVSVEDLDQQACIGQKLAHQIQSQDQSSLQDIEQIFLTGASGFLGSHLLFTLLKTSEAHLTCLVRASNLEQALAKIKKVLHRHGLVLSNNDLTRITIVLGNIEEDRLGLSNQVWCDLIGRIDGVFHCAASVNLTQTLENLFRANVLGVQHILDFVSAGKCKALNYISTLSVFVSSEYNRGRLLETDSLLKSKTLYGGYAQSKWVAERLVSNAAEKGLKRIKIFRLGLITGSTTHGIFGDHDFFTHLVRGLVQTKSVPDSQKDDIHVDITPVDYAASVIGRIGLAMPVNVDCSVFHIANDQPLSYSRLIQELKACGFGLDKIESDTWLAKSRTKLAESSLSQKIAALCLCRLSSDADYYERHRALDLFQATHVQFDCSNTKLALRGSNISCPKPESQLIRLYLNKFNYN